VNGADKPTLVIPGMEKGLRVDSRVLEERIQKAVADGHRSLEIIAQGQHGIGGRLWRAGNETVQIRVMGTSGQRLGAMGFPNTVIDCVGPASDDVGWLNAGARIVVRGNATNGAGNAMAQGQIYVAGDIGARGMTMTKHNPRFAPPELWVLGGVGDSFAEFMAGGQAVVCGHGVERERSALGYRPCVGMVGGKIFFRGPCPGYSDADAILGTVDDEDWRWLTTGLKAFLAAIDRTGLYKTLTADRTQWQVLAARRPHEKHHGPSRSLPQFLREVWEAQLGAGGLIGDLTDLDRSPVDVIPTGDLRRFVPVWENEQYLPPCQAHCPTGIPVQKRWALIREGKLSEAVDLALKYTPFPATVCGHLCPNLCMQNCTRQTANLPAVDVTLLGRASLEAAPPEPARPTGKKIAVIGGGPAGLSVAWQLRLMGHEPVIHETGPRLGGKITETIPASRIPDDVLDHELARVEGLIHHVRKPVTRKGFDELKKKYDFIVVATGARKPRMIDVPGRERAEAALDFLRRSKAGKARVGRTVVVIGAGNVGCDAAAEAARLGAASITLIDIQAPASFGKEREYAEAAGAKFLWPRFTKTITKDAVELTTGEVLPAETVIVAVGDQPELGFLPEGVARERGFVAVDARGRTSDPQVFAVGDAVRPGLLTEAIGAGRTAAGAIDALIRGREETFDQLPPIAPERIKHVYFNAGADGFTSVTACAASCASCGACRDCGLCEQICPEGAIARRDPGNGTFAYEADAARCIGCGFCAGACPTGVWRLAENDPLE
jgi:NADPH-dependent glutamate synthase beta subunit-like oxidoreductase/glutamate synthase domain-containing protein 3/NAD-dependent dihydropyrimidine dehydrogenase PreA subunit